MTGPANIDRHEWDFTGIPRSEIGAAAAWEYMRSSRLVKIADIFLSTPFSWYIPSIGEDEIVWGCTPPCGHLSADRSPSYGTAIVADTLTMIANGKAVPELVIDELYAKVPDVIVDSPAFGMFLISINFTEPWVRLSSETRKRLVDYLTVWFADPVVALSADEITALIRSNRLHRLESILREHRAKIPRKVGRAAEPPYAALAWLAVFRLSAAGYGRKQAYDLALSIRITPADETHVSLPLCSAASQWSDQKRWAKHLLDEVSTGDFSFLLGRMPIV